MFNSKTLTHLCFFSVSTGSFTLEGGQKAVSRQMTLDPVWLCIIQSFAFASGLMWFSLFQYLYCCLF